MIFWCERSNNLREPNFNRPKKTCNDNQSYLILRPRSSSLFFPMGNITVSILLQRKLHLSFFSYFGRICKNIKYPTLACLSATSLHMIYGYHKIRICKAILIDLGYCKLEKGRFYSHSGKSALMNPIPFARGADDTNASRAQTFWYVVE